jgi:hypothetical protein
VTDKERVLAEALKRLQAGEPVQPAAIARSLRIDGPEYDRGAPVRRMLAELAAAGALSNPQPGQWLPESVRGLGPGVHSITAKEAGRIKRDTAQRKSDRAAQDKTGIRVFKDEEGEYHVVIFDPTRRTGSGHGRKKK